MLMDTWRNMPGRNVMCATILDSSLRVSQGAKNKLPYDSAILF